MEIDHLSMFKGELGYEDCCERIGPMNITPYLDGEVLEQCVALCISEGWADVQTDQITADQMIATKRVYGKISIVVKQGTVGPIRKPRIRFTTDD